MRTPRPPLTRRAAVVDALRRRARRTAAATAPRTLSRRAARHTASRAPVARVATALAFALALATLAGALGPAFRPAPRIAAAQPATPGPAETATLAPTDLPATNQPPTAAPTPIPTATTPPTPRPPGILKNISTRGFIGRSQHQVLIAGFIVQGGPVKVLVRALGPSLTAQGVPGALPDPYVSLYSGQTIIAENDNWNGDPDVTATGLTPAHPNDSALVRTLAPGAYTAKVAPSRPSVGVALVEVFFVSGAGRLTNISTRGLVMTGDNVMIGGFIVRDGPVRVLLRALGPGLASHGVPGVLANPMISIFQQAAFLTENDDWGTRPEAAALQAAGAAPAFPSEAALLLDLEPGSYGGIVRGVAGGTGIGLVEVFNVGP